MQMEDIMGKPDFVVIRHINDVYMIPKSNLGDPLPGGVGGNDAIIDRTYASPFLDGLAFGGGYSNTPEITDGTRGSNHLSRKRP